MKLNKEIKKKFNQNGFLILDIFSKKDLKQFENALFYLIKNQAVKANKNKANIDINKRELTSSVLNNLEKFNHDYVSDVCDFLPNMTESLNLLANMKLKRVINYLLDNKKNDPLYITNGGPIIAMPNDKNYKYGFHKDTFYTLPYGNFIKIWSPLVKKASIHNGALQICLKSHLNKWYGQIVVDKVPNRHRYRVKSSEVSKYKIKNCTLKLGQVLIFSPYLAHQSGTNSSKEARFSLVGCYHKLDNHKIRPLLPGFKFKGKTPEDYYKELFL